MLIRYGKSVLKSKPSMEMKLGLRLFRLAHRYKIPPYAPHIVMYALSGIAVSRADKPPNSHQTFGDMEKTGNAF
jgi:hypothetical protein